MAQNIDRIGFLIHNSEMFNHYRSVWQHLPAGSVEIAVAGPQKDQDHTIQICEELKLPWRTAGDLLGQQQRYDILVSSFAEHLQRGSDSPYLPKSIGRHNLRFMYATGKAGWNFRPWNEMYDAILCFGPYQAEQLDFCRNSLKVQMGYPRFDRFFNQPIDRDNYLRKLGLDPARKTVVWLPTWKALCSIDLFVGAIADLQSRYNVIVKPHPITLTDEPARMRQLEAINCCIREHMDNVELFQLADFLLCDYGGSSFGGIYTDRNVVLLDIPHAESDPFVGEDSSELWLRKIMPHLGAHEVHKLPALLEDAQLWEQQRSVRMNLSQYFFAPFHGFASQVAALAIANSPKMLNKGR
jgi:hypothetical protein